MTHDDGEGSNVSIAARTLKEETEDYTFTFLTKKDSHTVKSLSGLRTILSFFVIKPYMLARAKIILLDNIFLPYAYINRRNNTKVVQLWHGTGSIKKFGQDANTGKLKELEKRANAKVTHLIVNSPSMVKLYSGAFGIKNKFIYPIGLPKTDELLRRIKIIEAAKKNQDKEYIFSKYGIPKGKKLVLYAPTFRDNEIDSPRMAELIKELDDKLSEEYYIGLRLHPFVAETFQMEHKGRRICQMSFEKDINTLILASDILVTDYSSIVFEYCLTTRPMIFYAYDYEEFSNQGRGFYHNYKAFVPGPVASNSQEVIDLINKNEFDLERIKEFTNTNYFYEDGNATSRLVELLKQ
jgi:CDP-ribitol ribitolphosphotransferase